MQRLRGLATSMAALTSDTIARWRALPESERTLDVHGEMMRLTFRIVGKTLFNSDVEGDAQAIGKALTIAMRFANDYIEQLQLVPPWLPLPKNMRFQKARRTLDALVYRITTSIAKVARPRAILLGMLMSATDDGDGSRMTPKQLRDEVMTLVLAGFETTANALTWALYLLATPCAEKSKKRSRVPIAATSKTCRGSSIPSAPTRSDAPVSAGVVLERMAIEADEIGGYAIPAGTTIAICPYVLHRNPAYWDNPDAFDPDRFRPSDRTIVHASPISFGDGSCICIGKNFAMMEPRSFSRCSRVGFGSAWRTKITSIRSAHHTRPRNGMRMTLTPRRT